jgi:hypothetical protein
VTAQATARRRLRRRAWTVAGLLALAMAATPSAAQAAATVSMSMRGGDRTIAYGEAIHLRGRAASERRSTVALQYAPRGRGWRTVRRKRTDGRGRYSVAARPSATGSLRVVQGGRRSRPKRVQVIPRLSGRARRDVLRGRRALVRGLLKPGYAGRTVLVQARGRGGWRTVDRARTRRGGRYRATWRPRRPGRYLVRVTFRGDGRNLPRRRMLRGRVNVYRPGKASWYGPGFYGNRTACGRRLGRRTLGVAHKRLRCGTRVTLYYRGRTVTVPVIDRGPYSGGREWDLTAATKRRLRFGSTGTVWSTR